LSNLFEEYAQKSKPDSKLAILREKCEEAVNLELAISDLENETKQLNKRLNVIKTTEIPELMSEIGVDKFELSDGTKIKISEFVAGSLPKENEARKKAFQWLEDHELGSIIKTDVNLTFGKGEDNMAKNLIASLQEQEYDPVVTKTVHPQTLQSSIKELMRDGKEVPLDDLGLYAGKTAKINLGK